MKFRDNWHNIPSLLLTQYRSLKERINLQRLVSKVYSYWQMWSHIAKVVAAVAELNADEILLWLSKWENSCLFNYQLHEIPWNNLTCQVISDSGSWPRATQQVGLCDAVGVCDINSSLLCFPAWHAKPQSPLFLISSTRYTCHAAASHMNLCGSLRFKEQNNTWTTL